MILTLCPFNLHVRIEDGMPMDGFWWHNEMKSFPMLYSTILHLVFQKSFVHHLKNWSDFPPKSYATKKLHNVKGYSCKIVLEIKMQKRYVHMKKSMYNASTKMIYPHCDTDEQPMSLIFFVKFNASFFYSAPSIYLQNRKRILSQDHV